MADLFHADLTNSGLIYKHKRPGRITIVNKHRDKLTDILSRFSHIANSEPKSIYSKNDKLRAIGAHGFIDFNEYLAYKRAKNRDYKYAIIDNEVIMTSSKSDNLQQKPNRLSNIFYTLEVPQSPKTFDNEFAEIMANTVIEKMSGPFSKTIVANISNYQDLEYARKKYPGMFLDQGYELQADYGDVCDRCGKPINRKPGNTNFLCYDCNKIVNENKRPLTRGSILKQPSEQVILSSL